MEHQKITKHNKKKRNKRRLAESKEQASKKSYGSFCDSCAESASNMSEYLPRNIEFISIEEYNTHK